MHAMAEYDDADRTMRAAKRPVDSREHLMKQQGTQNRSSSQKAPSTRVFGPRTLGSLLTPVTRFCLKKQNAAAARLMMEWDQIAGDAYARTATPKKLASGTLTLSCSGPAALELQYAIPQIIEKVNRWNGSPLVSRIRLVQDATPPKQPERKSNRPPARQLPPKELPVLDDLPEGPLREALEALGTRIKERS